MVQALFDGAHIDGFLHNFEVVRDTKAVRVDRLVEDRHSVATPELVDQTLGGLIPAIVERNV